MSVVATRHADALVEAIRKRLGERLVVRPADVAAACDVSVNTVYNWIEEGVVDAVNIGRGGRACWQVLTTSVVAFYERRKEAM